MNLIPPRKWEPIKTFLKPLPLPPSKFNIVNSLPEKVTQPIVLIKQINQTCLPGDIKRLGQGIVDVWTDRSPKTCSSKNQLYAKFNSVEDLKKFELAAPHWLDGRQVLPTNPRGSEPRSEYLSAVEGSVNVLLTGLPVKVTAAELFHALNGFGVLSDPRLAFHKLPPAHFLQRSRWMVRCVDESSAWRMIRKLNFTEWSNRTWQDQYILQLQMIGDLCLISSLSHNPISALIVPINCVYLSFQKRILDILLNENTSPPSVNPKLSKK
ncbi:hypothetical protein NEOLI_005067, partial [Neolecta irregularis DAH-3]